MCSQHLRESPRDSTFLWAGIVVCRELSISDWETNFYSRHERKSTTCFGCYAEFSFACNQITIKIAAAVGFRWELSDASGLRFNSEWKASSGERRKEKIRERLRFFHKSARLYCAGPRVECGRSGSERRRRRLSFRDYLRRPKDFSNCELSAHNSSRAEMRNEILLFENSPGQINNEHTN